MDDNRGTVTILYRVRSDPLISCACTRACVHLFVRTHGRRNRNLNRPRDGQQVLSRSRFNRTVSLDIQRAREGRLPPPPFLIRGSYGKNRLVTSLIHLLPLARPRLLIYRREKAFDFFYHRENDVHAGCFSD